MSDICMFHAEGKTNPWQKPTQFWYIIGLNGRLELQAMEGSLPAIHEKKRRMDRKMGCPFNGMCFLRLEI